VGGQDALERRKARQRKKEFGLERRKARQAERRFTS